MDELVLDKVVLILLAGTWGFDPYIWAKLIFPFSKTSSLGLGPAQLTI